MNMMDIRRRMLIGMANGLSVSSVSTAAHTAVDLSSLTWDELAIYGNAIAADTSHTYTNDTKSVTFSDGQTLGIGDVHSVVLTGTVGYLTLSNYTIYCFILGFRHNFSVEGTGIHFQFGKTGLGGTDVALVDGRYNTTGTAVGFKMNLSDTNAGGWDSSYMYGTIIPAFYSAVPSDLQSVLATMTKYTDNTGYGYGTASYVTATNEQFSLAAEYEIFGTCTYANSAEKNYQQQYAYYKAGNSKIKYKHSYTATACYSWNRSPSVTSDSGFCTVNATGAKEPEIAYRSCGFAPIFSIGTAE